MAVVYDGIPPSQTVTLTIRDQPPVAAVFKLREGRGLRFAMVTDASGTRVDTLLLSTAAAYDVRAQGVVEERPIETYTRDFHEQRARAQLEIFRRQQVEGGPSNELNAPLPDRATTPDPGEAAQGPIAAVAPPASPFTPQGQGPIILQPRK
jgi:hypothetical protein